MNHTYKPLKRFGQNFLSDGNINRKIILAVALTPQDCVLEIGPGRGALTFELVKAAKQLVAVEIDKGLYANLCLAFSDVQNIDIINGDILKFDFKKYAKEKKIKSFKVVANLPYYITTPIIEFLFKNITYIDDIFIMVQKEVAQRMVAQAGSQAYGSFSCFVNYFSKPSILFNISRNCFYPVPKVDSCFVRLTPYKPGDKLFKVKSEELFFKVMRSAFGQRRKRLISSLSRVVGKDVLKTLSAQDLLLRRPEQISLEEFVVLSNVIFDLRL